MYCPTHIMLDGYSTKTLHRSLFHKIKDIIMGRVSTFTLLEETFSYKSKEHVGKHITSKEITLGTGESLKETENIFEDDNYKQVQMRIGGTSKKKNMLRDQDDKQVHTRTGYLLTNKEMFRD